jgi:hypothetical protein
MAEANAATEKPSLAARAGAAVREGWDNLRIGDGHFTAWLRQGFKELTHLLLPAFPSGQHIAEEPGLFGNPTQGEVARGREAEPASQPRVAALNEEPIRRQTAVRSNGEIAEGPGMTAQEQDLPSPSEIADSNDRQQGQRPGQQQGQSQSNKRGRGM